MLCDSVWRLQKRRKASHYPLPSPIDFQGHIPIVIAQAKTALDRRGRSVGRARITDHHVIVGTGPAEMVLIGPSLPVFPAPPEGCASAGATTRSINEPIAAARRATHPRIHAPC